MGWHRATRQERRVDPLHGTHGTEVEGAWVAGAGVGFDGLWGVGWVNYYNRYPGHYLSKTLLLTLEQDGAYGRLMDWYYSEERAIPHEKRHTIGRCQSKKERDAIDFVLREFFVRSEDGKTWVHERIEKELAKAAPKIDAARENGKMGGRPRKEKPSGFPENNPVGFQNETQNKPSTKAPQTPYTIQEQEQETSRTPTNPEHPGTPAGSACALLKQAGCPRVNPSHPNLLAALSEGVTAEALLDTYRENPTATNPFAWAIATARSRHAEGTLAVNTRPSASSGKPPIAQNFSEKTYTGTPDDELPAYLRSA